MKSRIALATGLLTLASADPKCCYSNFGTAATCGGYPTGGAGGLCNNDYTTSCSADTDCQNIPAPTPAPPPAPTPAPAPPAPTPAPAPPAPPAPTPAPAP